MEVKTNEHRNKAYTKSRKTFHKVKIDISDKTKYYKIKTWCYFKIVTFNLQRIRRSSWKLKVVAKINSIKGLDIRELLQMIKKLKIEMIDLIRLIQITETENERAGNYPKNNLRKFH